jgi:hypothetical protein
MKAAQFFGKGHIEVLDVDEPTPADDEVLVEIHWCGICGSDLHEYISWVGEYIIYQGHWLTMIRADGDTSNRSASIDRRKASGYFRT